MSEFEGLKLGRRQVLGGAATLALTPMIPLRAGEADAASRASTPITHWPSRALLVPDLSRSLDRRNLAKTVHERLVIDDMESDGAWAASPPVTLTYSKERYREGTRSMRMRVALRNEDYIHKARSANGSFNGQGVLFDGTPFSASITKTFDKPQDWTRYNRISLWCFVHPTNNPALALSLQFLCEGASAGPTDPIAIHYFADLQPGRWNQLAWEIPEQRRDRVTRVVLFQSISGLPFRDASPDVVYDFDELCVERVDAEQVDGWAVIPGHIAHCHVGYAPQAAKIAISADGSPEFSIVEAASGKTAATLAAVEVTNRRGTFRVLDFGTFDKPGSYRLSHGSTSSEPFEIAADRWRTVVDATMNAFYGLRCGFAVPGVHDACHLDVFCEHAGQRRPVGGGWHDAANLTQGPYRTHLSIYALIELHEALQTAGDKPRAERALEEALWGIEWSLRMRFAPGLRTLYGEYSYYTDGIPGTDDDVVQEDKRAEVGRDPFQNTLAVLAAARAARALRRRDPALAKRLISAAREDYAVTTMDVRPPADAPPLEINEPSWRDRIGYLTLAAVELFRATGDQKYAKDAARFARLLIGTQERRFVDGIPVTGYFYEDAGRTRLVHEYHNGFEDSGLLAFAALCEALPDHPDWIDWYAGLAIYYRHFLLKGTEASAPFEVIPAALWRRADLDAAQPLDRTGAMIAGMGPSPLFPTVPTPEVVRAQMLQQFEAGEPVGHDYRLRVFPLWYDGVRHGATTVQLGKTIGLSAAARVLRNHEASELAERQLQWVTGANPLSRSLMFGVGHDFWQNFSVSLPNFVGGLSLGFNSLRDDSPAWGNNALFPYKEQWVFSSCRVAHLLARVGMPARVTGATTEGATFRHVRTGKVTRIQPGRFDELLPGGSYEVKSGSLVKQLSLADGAQEQIELDPSTAVVLALSVSSAAQERVSITLELSGRGRHRLAARLFNARLDGLPKSIQVSGDAPSRLNLQLTVEKLDTPWVLVLIPDGQLSERVTLEGRA